METIVLAAAAAAAIAAAILIYSSTSSNFRASDDRRLTRALILCALAAGLMAFTIGTNQSEGGTHEAEIAALELREAAALERADTSEADAARSGEVADSLLAENLLLYSAVARAEGRAAVTRVVFRDSFADFQADPTEENCKRALGDCRDHAANLEALNDTTAAALAQTRQEADTLRSGLNLLQLVTLPSLRSAYLDADTRAGLWETDYQTTRRALRWRTFEARASEAVNVALLLYTLTR